MAVAVAVLILALAVAVPVAAVAVGTLAALAGLARLQRLVVLDHRRVIGEADLHRLAIHLGERLLPACLRRAIEAFLQHLGRQHDVRAAAGCALARCRAASGSSAFASSSCAACASGRACSGAAFSCSCVSVLCAHRDLLVPVFPAVSSPGTLKTELIVRCLWSAGLFRRPARCDQ